MIKVIFQRHNLKKIKGQSLVEMAISLPLFILLIAGIVEIGNLLVQRQRITTATDMAVRFGSRGGSNEGIQLSAYGVLTQTMPIDNLELWDMYVVRGTVNDEGSGWVDGTFGVFPVYGAEQSELAASLAITANQIALGNEMLEALQTRIDLNDIADPVKEPGAGNQAGRDQAAGEDIVGVVMSYKAETILGIDDVFDQDFELVTEKYMTVHVTSDRENGCDVYPIALSNGNVRNIDPIPDTSKGEVQGQTYYAKTSTNYQPNVDSIGNLALYDYPADPPEWSEFRPSPGVRTLIPDQDGNLAAGEGDVYFLEQGVNFEWLFFDDNMGVSTTVKDMTWPTRSRENYDAYDFTLPDTSPGEGLHIGDRVKHATGANSNRAVNITNPNNPNNPLNEHIDTGRAIRVPVINLTDWNLGSDNLKIGGFIILKLRGYGTAASGNTFLVAEAVRYDQSCGQVISQ